MTPTDHADACPRCCTRDNEPALATVRKHTLVAVYCCRNCRHGWWTTWALDLRSAA